MSNDYFLSNKSLRLLEGVHDDLSRVARRAITETKIDFGISEGLRDYERQTLLFHEKKTTTLHSLHLAQKDENPDLDGLSHAIDVFAWVNDKIQWNNKYYGPIVQAFTTAAIALGIQIQFGHLWLDFMPGKGADSVHIQLNPKYYNGNLINRSNR